MPVCTVAALERGVARLFSAADVPAEAARIVSQHLVDAESRGVVSHGVIRVPQYMSALRNGDIRPAATLRVIRQSQATIALDGEHGFGQVMATQAMQHAVDLAKRVGVAAVTLTNCSHTGRLGAYTEQAASQDTVGLMMVNSGGNGQWVAPYGGVAGRLSTNPLSIAVPQGPGEPLVLDMATSAVPEGKIRALAALNQQLPEGCVVDHLGRPTTQPSALYGPPRGAILPFGGHKGFGLGLMVDVLAGALSGAGCCERPDAPLAGTTDGVLLVAINIDSFCPRDAFCQTVARLVQHVKSSPPGPGFQDVIAPGELEAAARSRHLAEGLPLPDSTWQLLTATATSIGLDFAALLDPCQVRPD